LFDLSADEYSVVHNLDPPSIDGIQRRSPKNRTGAKVEAGVVERASDGRGTHDPVAEVTAIVCAGAADREELAFDARQQDRIVADAA
jgi:hypothetical protein